MSQECFPLHTGSGGKEGQREPKRESISKQRKSEVWQAECVRNGLTQSARGSSQTLHKAGGETVPAETESREQVLEDVTAAAAG